MKTYALCSLWVLVFEGLWAQSITHVTPEAVGDKIIVRYDISDSKEDQLFEVALYYSKDNFSQTLRNVSGNGVGPAVSSGKNLVIIWDVLKEVSSLEGEFTFEVRAFPQSKMVEVITIAGAGNRNVSVTNKDEAYPIMATTLTDYINEAKDFKDAFGLLGVQATESRAANAKLIDATEQYSRAFEKLNKERLTYEKYVAAFWKNDVQTLEFKSLMDYAIGDLHGVNILTLNQKITTINDIASGKVKRPGEAKKELAKDISEEVLRLDKRLQELERRTNRILYELSQD